MKNVGTSYLLRLSFGILVSSMVSGTVVQHAYADNAQNSGTTVSISLKNDDLPASDIVYPGAAQSTVLKPECRYSTILTPECAQDLKTSGVDLSTLDPDTSTDLWKGPSSEGDEDLDQALPLSDNQETTYVGVIESSSGRFRFNVRTDAGAQPAQTLTIMVGTTLHTFLMRKELLRRLGYVIPPMKYLHQIKVRFDTIKNRDEFLQNQFQNAIRPSISRWIPELAANAKTQALELTFQDVAVMQATPLIYDLAIGIPIQQIPGSTSLRAEGARILRSVAIPAGLSDVPESVNLFDWTLGQVQNQAVTFHTPDQTIYGCTEDDAVWMLRRLAKLTREDFTKIVKYSYYPDAVAQILVEKLISRRNTILTNFNVNIDALPYDKKPNLPPALDKNGKPVQMSWPGYGSSFSGIDPISPLHGLQWYIVSETASNVMSELLTKVNEKLPGLMTMDQITKHETDLQNSFVQYLMNGETPPMNMGAWVAPIANGSVAISRDVVLGNYLGTNNPVQLADTFGFTANVGMYVGVDNAPAFMSLSGLVQGTAQISFTHVKPLTSLKQGVTEPLKEEFVPWIMAHGAGILNTAASVQHETGKDPKQVRTDLVNDLNKIDDFLAPGDSLIVTESLNGLEQASATLEATQVFSNPAISASAQSNQEMISRLNFYRMPAPNANTIQVFKDNGQLINVIVQVEGGISKDETNGQASPVFPVISIMGKKVKGKAHSEIFNVNVDPNQGPSIYASVNALSSALTTGSVEQLEALQKPLLPLRLSVGFKDTTSEFQFFHLIHRTLKSNGLINVQTPDGTTGNYLYIQDGKQSGKSYQQLVTQAATYLAQLFSNDTTVNIDTQTPQNPGQSFLGSSHTRNTSFEARVVNKGISQPSVLVQYRWEGFNISQKDMIKLVGTLSAKYGYKLFNDGFLNDTKDIKMYQMDLNINLYQAALEAILTMSDADRKNLEKKYGALHKCDDYPDQLDQMSYADEDVCYAMQNFDAALHDYKRGKFKNASDQGKAAMTVASDLEQFVTFQDLVAIAGGTANIYVNAQINGFREGAEEISNPIIGSTFGNQNSTGGIVDAVEQLLGLQDGEFDVQWMRDIL